MADYSSPLSAGEIALRKQMTERRPMVEKHFTGPSGGRYSVMTCKSCFALVSGSYMFTDNLAFHVQWHHDTGTFAPELVQ